MLTFDVYKEVLAPNISSPLFLNHIAHLYIQKLWPKSELRDDYLYNDGKKYKILNKVLKRYAAKYVSYGKLEAELIDGYILCGIAQNYGEIYIYGLAHAVQIDPRGISTFYLQNLKAFGLWNSVECRRRGV